MGTSGPLVQRWRRLGYVTLASQRRVTGVVEDGLRVEIEAQGIIGSAADD